MRFIFGKLSLFSFFCHFYLIINVVVCYYDAVYKLAFAFCVNDVKEEDKKLFCTECGTKLDDGAVFCTNCGKQLAATAEAAPVSEPTPVVQTAPVSEPAPAASQSMYSEPVSQPMYTETNSQSTYGDTQGAYGSAQNAYGSSQNTYNGVNPSYGYGASVQQEPPKKKGKGCLIAAIIVAGIGLLGLLAIVIVIIMAASLGGCSTEDESSEPAFSYDYEYESESESDDYDFSEIESESESESESEDVTVSAGDYAIEDLYGEWNGTSTLVSVTGAEEMQEYLEYLYGRPLTETEISGLTDVTFDEDEFYLYISNWYDEEVDEEHPGTWYMELDMGDFFGLQAWDDYDALTYDEFMYGDRSAACITLDENNSFQIEGMEVDYIGEYGEVFFDAFDYDVVASEVEEDGAYGISFTGTVSEGASGPQIEGEIVIMFQYGDMEEPYGMAYEYVLDSLYR